MPRTINLFFIVLLLTGLALPSYADQPKIIDGFLDLSNWHSSFDSPIELKGEWNMVPNQLLDSSQIQLAKPIMKSVPDKWLLDNELAGIHLGRGIATYWIDLAPPALYNNIIYGLNVSMVCSSANFYFYPINEPSDQFVANMGLAASDSSKAIPFQGSKVIPLNFSTNQTHRLMIQVSNNYYWTGGLCGLIQLDIFENATALKTQENIKIAMVISFLLMAFLYQMSFYLQNPGSKDAMTLGFACLSMAIVFVNLGSFPEAFFKLNHTWLFELKTRTLYIGVSWLIVMLFMFLNYFMGLIFSSKCINLALLAAFFFNILMVVTPINFIWIVIALIMLFTIFLSFLSIYILIQGLNGYKDGARIIFVAGILCLIVGPWEIYSYRALGETPIYTFIAILFFLYVINYIVSKNYANSVKLSERLSRDLQGEVKRQTRELNKKNYELEKAHFDLQQANINLKQLSIIDSLTGLSNRMHFMEELNKEWRRCARHQANLSILMIDADHFKHLNDNEGHIAGDLALKKIAAVIEANTKRARELAARFGGEEFIAMLPDCDLEEAKAIAENIRSEIAAADIHYHHQRLQVTVSIGVTTKIPTNDMNLEMILETADKAMYQAKRNGRNQIAVLS